VELERQPDPAEGRAAGPCLFRGREAGVADLRRAQRARKESMRYGERSAYSGNESTVFITASTTQSETRQSMRGLIR
jgi:hypothetical protein